MQDKRDLIRQVLAGQDEAARKGPRLPGSTWAWIFREQDRLADLAFTGGFDTRKRNICTVCRLAKPASGRCCE